MPAARAAVAGDWGTTPPPTVTVFIVVAEPAHVPLLKREYVTLPDGVNPVTPVTVAVS